MNKTVGIIAGLGLLYYTVLRGASALTIGIRGYQLSGVDLVNKTVQVRLNFYIKNPLFVGIKLRGIVGDVYMQGMKVGSINSSYDYFLSGGGKVHSVPVTVTCSMASLGEAMIANIQSGNVQTLTVAFDGSIRIGKNGVAIPIQKTLDWREIQKW